MINRRILTGFFLLAIIFSSVWVQTARADTITVNTNNDVLDAAGVCASVTSATLPGPDGVTSLREAMCAANTNPGEDTINFNIPGAGIQMINLGSALPQLIDGNTTINGYTQFGAMPANGSTPATILIALNGTGILNNGLNITSAGNEIRGLAIYGFMGSEIYLVNQGGGIAMDNVIAGNYLGSDPSGLVCPAPANKGLNGVFIGQAAQNNLIGGDTPADRNLILCNGWEGVGIHGSGTIENVVSGNYIGVGPMGTTAMPNTLDGVRIYGGAQDNTIGGVSVGAGNLISSNLRDGVRIVGEGTNENQVLGNMIGLEPDGASPQGNDQLGVYLGGGAQENLIGGDTPSERNVISQNLVGIVISDTTTISNTISGNYIGVDASGSGEAGNRADGVIVKGGAQNNLIGGDSPGERNVISGNDQSGILIDDLGTTGIIVSGNYIGTDATGTTALPNNFDGINIRNAGGNLIGGDTPGEQNVISGNGDDGIHLEGLGTAHNLVVGNYIGVDVNGSTALPNINHGVLIDDGASSNTVGGDRTAGEGNLISGNGENGVYILEEISYGNVVAGNFIGTDATGLVDLGNMYDGVILVDSGENLIGGETSGEGNTISGNNDDGIVLLGTTTNNVVSGNYIGLGADGTTSLPNAEVGLLLATDALTNTIGGDSPGERNVISANGEYGIEIFGDNNTISGNYIGTDATGTVANGNTWDGIYLTSGAENNTIGGDSPEERNLISGNNRFGIELAGDNNTISGNYIGTNANGAAALGNATDGIYLNNDAENNTIGGDTPGERNIISGNGDDGVELDGADSNTISGNYIGVTAGGTSALANVGFGVVMSEGAQDNTIGGTTESDSNIISGNDRDGIYISSSTTSNNVVTNNYIGTDSTGIVDLGNGEDGIELDFGTHNNTIGPGNIVAHNGSSGVYVDHATTLGNIITQNRIFTNFRLGINLDEDAHGGITPPVVTGTTYSSGVFSITGTACASCIVEVFGNSTNDGEGQFYVGSTTADGGGAFSLTLPFQPYPYVTATATDAPNGTSEFSDAFTSTVQPCFMPVIRR